MSQLLETIGRHFGSQDIDRLSETLGATPEQTRNGIGAVLPSILAGLAKNADDPGSRQQLDHALQHDHDGSLLDNLGAMFGGRPQEAPVPDRATAGDSILGHIFGGRKERVADRVSHSSGLSGGQTLKLMMLLAPVVMAALGKMKRQSNLNQDQIAETLHDERRHMETAGGGSIVGRMLDQDGDGDFDLMDMMKFGVKRMFG